MSVDVSSGRDNRRRRRKVAHGGDGIGGPRGKGSRLDTLLVLQGLVQSRERAKALILAGKVRVWGERVDKAGTVVAPDADIEIEEHLPYVSRGGLKLAAALDAFGLDPSGLRILDAGISTGGFTDCLLQRGAAQIVGVDVGYGQVDWAIRSDPRVVLFERENIRYVTAEKIGGPVDAAVVDVSFISLEKVLPAVFGTLKGGGWVIVLVKPQFEVGKGLVGKGGIVRDPALRAEAVERVARAVEALGGRVRGCLPSPILGAKGNEEFLMLIDVMAKAGR